jgi:hypothetical protein
MQHTYHFMAASEAELNEIVEGKVTGIPIDLDIHNNFPRTRAGTFGVIFREPSSELEAIRPLALVVASDDQRRLFSRFSQLRGDLSPLSAWCHLITPQGSGTLDGLIREVNFSGFEAAWIGLAVAEAILLAERSVGNIKVAACLATQTYAVARTLALWDRISIDEVIDRYDTIQKLVRTTESNVARLRAALGPIWSALSDAATNQNRYQTGHQHRLTEAIKALHKARQQPNRDESRELHFALAEELPESHLLLELSKAPPEARLHAFDALVSAMDDARSEPARYNALAFLAGYLATVAAGGSPSMGLAEAVAGRSPEVTAWAYAIGGIGEKVTWTSSFDGLGRLVARELMRPFRIDEAPSCDFAFDEATVLVDKQLSDPLVHLKIKQLRVVTVSIYPGVNISVSLAEQPRTEPERRPRQAEPKSSYGDPSGPDPLELLADALLPYLQARLAQRQSGRAVDSASAGFQRRTGKAFRKGGYESKLPLEE